MPPKKSKNTAAQKATIQEQNNGKWTWKESKTCIYGYSTLTSSQKVASFDMDSTLIEVKSGAKFPKDANDWIYWDKSVPQKLRQLSKEGYKIIIYTNQKGISTGKTSANDIKTKIQNIAKDVGIQMTAFIASEDDEYRKPNTKMWQMHDNELNKGVKVNKKISYFCGDAAGRNDGKHKDWSDTDIKFALNLGVPFKLPENVFLGQQEKQIQIKGFNPKNIPDKGQLIKNNPKNEVKFVEKQMVIFVGSPGAGKSTFWQNYMPKYQRVNRDTLKTKQKCYKVAQEEILKGNSVIIDNTNPKKQDRKYFIDLAKKYGYKVRCFYFLTSKDICFHNDYQRVVNDKRKHLSGKAGSIPIHGWFKNKQEPTLDEGFYEINHVNFIAKYENQDQKTMYQSFTKK